MPCLRILAPMKSTATRDMGVLLDLPPLYVFIMGEAPQTTHRLRAVGSQAGLAKVLARFGMVLLEALSGMGACLMWTGCAVVNRLLSSAWNAFVGAHCTVIILLLFISSQCMTFFVVSVGRK